MDHRNYINQEQVIPPKCKGDAMVPTQKWLALLLHLYCIVSVLPYELQHQNIEKNFNRR
jgi:hypothetical protein